MHRISLLLLGLVLLVGCTPKYVSPNPPRAVYGDPNATVVVEEYGDFQCPACGVAYQEVKELKQEFGDKVAWKYYHFPLTNIHPYAFNASLAAECANDQGKFWEYHDRLFENQDKLSRGDLHTHAETLGLNVENFDACFKSRAKTSLVKEDFATGESRGVRATPTFFLNGQVVDDWTTLKTTINGLLSPAVPAATTTP